MFNAATDAIDVLQRYHLSDDLLEVMTKLINAQRRCEEIYMEE
jgi:hypothetical protein